MTKKATGQAPNAPMIDRLARAIESADEHSCQMQDGVDYRALGAAVLRELHRELAALVEYENAINWMTTCTGCARVLDSCIRETERAERAEAAIERARSLATRLEEFAENALRNDDRDLYAAIAADLRKRLEDRKPDAHDGGPSVQECAAADRRWPLEKEGS